jgi:hypothetical protein
LSEHHFGGTSSILHQQDNEFVEPKSTILTPVADPKHVNKLELSFKNNDESEEMFQNVAISTVFQAAVNKEKAKYNRFIQKEQAKTCLIRQ